MVKSVVGMLYDLGFSENHIKMMLLCSLAAAAGGIVHIFILTTNFSEWPIFIKKEFKEYKEKKASIYSWHEKICNVLYFIVQLVKHLLFSPYWIISRIILSLVAGVIVSLSFFLYFPLEECTSLILSKALLLSIFIGYGTPAILLSQGRWIVILTTSTKIKKNISGRIKDMIQTIVNDTVNSLEKEKEDHKEDQDDEKDNNSEDTGKTKSDNSQPDTDSDNNT